MKGGLRGYVFGVLRSLSLDIGVKIRDYILYVS
jgi:hypothetical protein